MTPPLVYNLFPRLVGPMDRWLAQAKRAAAMGFNWLYLNPIQYPGFSGSLYAVKDYFRLNPAFVAEDGDDRLEAIEPVVRRIAELGLRPMIDLVINHTAKDSDLVHQHPDWYLRNERGEVESPYAVDPGDPQNVTVWGDLAEIDNAGSLDREALWDYWGQVMQRCLELGFEGFRCDAAYKVPAELWRYLVERAERAHPEVRFFAETLGCTLEEARALRDSGMHFFFNSSKWWNFEAVWALEQHQEFEAMPSISFPESHDTPRLAAESGGNQAILRQRYAFAACFSAGLMIPVGYEFGFRKPLNVVETRPEDWEETAFDLQPFVSSINRLKAETPLLNGEGKLEAVSRLDEEVLVLSRRSDQAPGQVGWIVVNKHVDESRALQLSTLPAPATRASVFRLCRDEASHAGRLGGAETLSLDPAEVVLLVADE